MLKYSFSEVKHKKTMPILEFKEKGNINIKLEELVPLRDMREIKDTIEELLKKENYEGTNTDDYIRAIITNEEPLYDAIGQIRSIYPNVLKLEIQNSRTTLEIQQENLKEVKNKSEIELFNEFYKFQNNVELNDEQIIEIIAKESKKRKDSLADYEKSGREDLISQINEEIEVLQEYLPKQLTQEELEENIKKIITQVEATSIKDMGKVMKVAKEQIGARADGKTINEVVKKLLA